MKITKRQLRRLIREADDATGGASTSSIKKGLALAFPDWAGDIGGMELKSGVVDEFAGIVKNAMQAAASGDLVKAEKMSDTASKQMEGRMLRTMIREIMAEDKSGKGACPDTGCIKKGQGGWRIISNKTGKLWPQKYKTRKSAEAALRGYHASRG